MSGHPTYVLLCDGRDEVHPEALTCWQQWRPADPTDATRRLTDVRGQASEFGWRNVVVARKAGPAPSLDFCPSCVEGGVMAQVVEKITVALAGAHA